MRFLFFGPVFLFYTGLCFYTGIKLSGFIRHFLPGMKAIIFWIPFILLCYGLVFAGFRHNLGIIRKAGLYWMAILVYLLLLFSLSDLTRLILFFLKKSISNYQFYSVGASLILCVIIIVVGALHARSVKTVNYQLTLPGSSGGIRIALISDLHIGTTGTRWMRNVADAINRSQPDIVCISGDIFDGNVSNIKDLSGIVSEISRIAAPMGIYACLGNHDVDRLFQGRTERIVEILREAGVIVLQDEAMNIMGNLYIAGRKDARPIGMAAGRKTPEKLFAGLTGTIIVLDHQPTDFKLLEQAGATLALCGHTHAGQLFPANLMTRMIFKKAGAAHYGHWRSGNLQAVITSGAGFWGPPVRIGTNSEVAVINVRFDMSACVD
jgi:predicted MPP superfamily phosphohydrolase